MYEKSISFITSNLKKLQGNKGINTIGDIEIPEIPIQELIINMLIHRDYFVNSSCKIFIFDNRIELISPGHLPNNLTVENIKTGNSNIRNDVLASFAMKELPYRGLGTGILRALEHYPHIDFENDVSNNRFICTIHRPNHS